eukprot:CAMPEP_0172885528 /NCGR_PEP_ID=MMETSP1075-20121228/128341_1 /TAXON_ID=2916 /ORGANISM="Ceratium fusus, Strain PA161109" /LENGTH=43 /DNA_ID= /DNA_START= /DNA_END= /DNA_ORIENTATION=
MTCSNSSGVVAASISLGVSELLQETMTQCFPVRLGMQKRPNGA